VKSQHHTMMKRPCARSYLHQHHHSNCIINIIISSSSSRAGSGMVCHTSHLLGQLKTTFTFTFGEDSMLSSAEAVISLGPMRRAQNHTIITSFLRNTISVCLSAKTIQTHARLSEISSNTDITTQNGQPETVCRLDSAWNG